MIGNMDRKEYYKIESIKPPEKDKRTTGDHLCLSLELGRSVMQHQTYTFYRL